MLGNAIRQLERFSSIRVENNGINCNRLGRTGDHASCVARKGISWDVRDSCRIGEANCDQFRVALSYVQHVQSSDRRALSKSCRSGGGFIRSARRDHGDRSKRLPDDLGCIAIAVFVKGEAPVDEYERVIRHIARTVYDCFLFNASDT